MMMYPEDSGGHTLSSPSSPWCFYEVSLLEGLNDAKRGAGFSCQLAKADQQLPLGIFSNLTSLQKDTCTGWPQFSQAEKVLLCIGPQVGPSLVKFTISIHRE